MATFLFEIYPISGGLGNGKQGELTRKLLKIYRTSKIVQCPLMKYFQVSDATCMCVNIAVGWRADQGLGVALLQAAE